MEALTRPLLLWDGDCGVCRTWARRWELRTEGRVEFAPSQDAAWRVPQVPAAAFARSVVLVEPSGRATFAAEAIVTMMALAGRSRWPLRAYRYVPGVRFASELGYRFLAAHRGLLALLTRVGWGRHADPDTWRISTEVFLRGVGLAVLIAFASLWAQVHGLVGSRGILPMERWLERAEGALGASAAWKLPTLFWFDASDAALDAACAAGALAGLLLLLGLVPVPALVAAWALYLSLVVVGRDFLSFQWDTLLLETCFVAVFLAPLSLRLGGGRRHEPPAAARLLAWWLLLRLMLLSGIVKLASGDPAWRDLSAMAFHHESQPLPTALAWRLHHLPDAAHRATTAVALAVELVLPLLIFMPRRLRHVAALGFAVLQVLIAVSGNYGFFNLLALALCVLLVEDAAWPAFVRRGFEARSVHAPRRPWPAGLVFVVALAVVAVTTAVAAARVLRPDPPAAVALVARAVAPARTFNAYGLFAVMTKGRPEIRVQGSADGRTWRDYRFRWKPGDPAKAPRLVQPHMPRLDWQAWFAALGTPRSDAWAVALCRSLLEGSPDVSRLFAENPFEGAPPVQVRILLEDYRFTTPEERARTAAWWHVEPRGVWIGPLDAEDFSGSR